MKYFGVTEEDLVVKNASLREFVNYVKANKNLTKFSNYLQLLDWLNKMMRRERDQENVKLYKGEIESIQRELILERKMKWQDFKQRRCE